jgi:hypothetical protein
MYLSMSLTSAGWSRECLWSLLKTTLIWISWFSHIDGRPRFAKFSIDDGKQVKIAAIDPDF